MGLARRTHRRAARVSVFPGDVSAHRRFSSQQRPNDLGSSVEGTKPSGILIEATERARLRPEGLPFGVLRSRLPQGGRQWVRSPAGGDPTRNFKRAHGPVCSVTTFSSATNSVEDD